MPNHLRNETSPYLKQHENNPVDWYPFSDEAFARARAEDKPILLSIGYSACHWCHVMAHESFEDPATAELMNELYVNVKVDREEMPDVDQVYQQAHALMGQGGGWPLTMFLLPDGTPFFGGTYFPPTERFGRPSFKRLLASLATAYKDQRSQVTDNARQFKEGLEHIAKGGRTAEGDELRADSVDRAAQKLVQLIDRAEGGFSGAPKFPNPRAVELILRASDRASDPADKKELLGAVEITLVKMAEGGVYDQLGGGFHRYSTDGEWLVPHFEKMLYDNAQLLSLYAEGFQATGNPLFPRIVKETAAYMERELRAPDGGFYTAQDADSEGVEGKYFVWTPAEVRALLSAERAALVERCLGVVPGGNWNDPHGHGPKGGSILHVVEQPSDPKELRAAMDELLAARQQRIAPGTDDKILASVNGLAIAGLAEAGRILGDATLVASARRTAEFLVEKMRAPDGRFFRTYKNGVAKLPGTLDDHAFTADGFIHLYEAGGGARWLDEAHRLTKLCVERFYDDAQRIFYLTAHDDAELIQRPVSDHDSAIPSGMTVVLENLLRLGHVCDEPRWLSIAEEVLRAHHAQALRNPFGLSNLMSALDLMQRGRQIVLAGDDTSAFERVLAEVYLPNRIVVFATSAPPVAAAFIEGKKAISSSATAYVCAAGVCRAPTPSLPDFKVALRDMQ